MVALWRKKIFALPVFLTFATVALLSAPAKSDEIGGFASVQSGNKILIGKRVVRLFGIKAPRKDDLCQIDEQKIKCGVVAWSALIRLADDWHVSCDIELKAKDGPDYATCYIGERDINEAMVRSGWAKAVRKQTDRYVVDEEDAKNFTRGLWATAKR
tara:strand:+ start:8406 stop:8876 length:471 start_codon:yes stop_codon:yes gene_type:complete